MAQEPQLYEIGLLIKSELSEEEAAAELGNVRSIIEKYNGMLERTTDPKIRKLSYPIRKIEQAYFAALQFSIAPPAIGGIEREVKTHDTIVRHLVLSWERTTAQPIVRRGRAPGLKTAAGSVPPADTPEKQAEKVDEKELDKKLDEILGN